ncbi:MAG: carboxylating nicotinate-nucleotide diphosphorylase [Verrucomicrobiae bacterium]|nr:carboxylating nicotinate-nucleotide diphosphorylase [Verrucomicrobiae bacterium]
MKPVLPPSRAALRALARAALREDLGARGDVTSRATIPPALRSRARLVARRAGVFCGAAIAREVFLQAGRGVRVVSLVRDGRLLRPGQTAMTITGPTRALLAGERTALNFVKRLSGISTLAARCVAAARRGNPRRPPAILDTRKTTPGLRALEKYAVRCGGGRNHRFGLYDMVLIKDNHLAALAAATTDPVGEAVRRARRRWPRLTVEIECDTLDQVRRAVCARPDFILLDNMPPATLKRAVRLVGGRAKTEASGGITPEDIPAIARTGVDFVSVGALTHSPPALDLALELRPWSR